MTEFDLTEKTINPMGGFPHYGVVNNELALTGGTASGSGDASSYSSYSIAGTYTRDLATATGRVEDLSVPRDREGQFHTQVFDRYRRFEPHIARSVSPRCSWPERAPTK